MSRIRQTGSSLEDELREERRLAAAMRRRRRKRWLIPLLGILAVVLALFLLIYFSTDHPAPQPDETEDSTPSEHSATLVFGGDVAMTPQMLAMGYRGGVYDYSACFTPITRIVSAADLALVNVEGNFCGEPYNALTANYPDALLTALQTCGFDVIQTANSYSIENGMTGLVSTKQAIEAHGMDALGTFVSQEERDQTGGVLIKEINGIRIALIGMTKGTNGLRLPDGTEYSVNLLFSDYDTNYTKIDQSGILSLIDNAKNANPDLIVCMLHWGSEYSRDVSDPQKEIAKLLLDNGVDVIVGSHPHAVSLIEWNGMPSIDEPHREGLLAYSLGDLLSAAERKDAHNGCMLSFTVEKENGEVRITQVQYIPTYSAYPDGELGVSGFTVYNMPDAIYLYESSHYDRVSAPLYQLMVEAVEKMKEQTQSTLQYQGEP